MIKINNNHNKHRKHFAVVLFGSFGTLLKFLRTQYSIAFLWQLSAWWLYWIACVIHFAILCTYASLISTTISASNILDGNHSGHFYISENIPPAGVRPLELVRGKKAATQQMWNLPPLIDLTGQSECTSTIKASSVRATLKMQYVFYNISTLSIVIKRQQCQPHSNIGAAISLNNCSTLRI